MKSQCKQLATVLLFFLFSGVMVAQEAHFRAMREDRGTEHRVYDLIHVALELKVDEQAKTLEGQVTNVIQPLRDELNEFWFDAAGLEIQSVLVEGEVADFSHEDHRLTVRVNPPLSAGTEVPVIIRYKGEDPQRGLYFIAPSEGEPDLLHEVWSQGQSEDNRYWIPTWDYPTDRATFAGRFTVREDLTVVSNGEWLGTEAHGDGWHTTEFRLDFPFPTYLISLCVGHYEKYVDTWRDIPVEYYVNAGVGEATARRSFSETPDVLEFFSKITGVDYPYPKYSQVAVQKFVAGGMENISATTQSDSTLHDEREHLDRTSRGLVAHEAAHQWFGDYLTCKTWRHLWLNEGFANYFEALYAREVEGVDHFRLKMRGQQGSAMRSRGAPRPLVESFFSRAPTGGGGNGVYVKGSSVLYMIHEQLGEELFFDSMEYFLKKHRAELVETDDLQQAIEEVTGMNLHWLFEQFVFLPGQPEFKVEKHYDLEAKELVLTVKQTQNTAGMVPVFRVPVPIELTFEEDVVEHLVWVDTEEQEIRLPAESEPKMVRFDKRSTLLKKLEFEKTPAEWSFQALHDNDAVGRIIAVEALQDHVADADIQAVLARVIQFEGDSSIRRAAVRALGNTENEAMTGAIQIALNDSDAGVRRAAVQALGQMRDHLSEVKLMEASQDIVARLQDDLSYRVQEEAARQLADFSGDIAWPALKLASSYQSPRQSVAKAALAARVKSNEPTVVEELWQQIHSDQSSFDTKATAMQALAKAEDSCLGERTTAFEEYIVAQLERAESPMLMAAIRAIDDRKIIAAIEPLQKLVDESKSRRLRFFGSRVLQALEPKDESESKPEDAAAAADGKKDDLEGKVEGLTAAMTELKAQLEELQSELEARKPATPAPER